MKMKYLYMSFLLALVYSCSDSGDNSDYSEMLKKDFNQEIKWDVDSLALMRASWEKTDLGNGAAVCTAQASMWGTTQSVSMWYIRRLCFLPELLYVILLPKLV